MIFTNKIHTPYIIVTLLRSVIVLRITVIFSPPNVTWKQNITSLGQKESKRRFAKSRNTRRNERNTTTTGGRICVKNCVFSVNSEPSLFFLFYFFFFLPVILFRFLWTFSHFCKNGVDCIINPLFFFFRTSASINFDIEGRNYLPRTKKYHVQPL